MAKHFRRVSSKKVGLRAEHSVLGMVFRTAQGMSNINDNLQPRLAKGHLQHLADTSIKEW